MMRLTYLQFLLAVVIGSIVGCGPRAETQPVSGEAAREPQRSSDQVSTSSEDDVPETRVTTPPAPPLSLSVPAEPPKEFGDNDLSTFPTHVLAAAAKEYVGESNFDTAVQLQHWSVTNGDGDSGLYNLACYYSLADNVEGALYWLQMAAAKEGVDADWALRDSDLVNVRRDSRWNQMNQFLRQYNRYWQGSDHNETTLILPAGYQRSEALTAVVGLHGMGSRARHFVEDSFQELADSMHVAFVGVSGTVPRGPATFVWSEDPQLDLARIDAALAEVSDRLTVASGKVILFGFSQGAMMAAEIAARHPDRFAGALAMSPGGNGDPTTGSLGRLPAHAKQGYVCVCGADEHPGNVAMTKQYADDMRQLKARVEHHPYPNVAEHSFPPDFYERLPAWIAFISDPDATEVAKAESNPDSVDE
ncbi:MAG: alpha/beta fold hydrolase [Planctomycetaceae bacterium]|nr:alpha/beta fold hydrolase [Planctomycetales bacterium]MCB9938461.1 alpha/beta fold hydrolase [Planctomycetaceae bacterium]